MLADQYTTLVIALDWPNLDLKYIKSKSEVWTYPNSVWSDGVHRHWTELARPYTQAHLKDAGY